jgi:hypothetical protein
VQDADGFETWKKKQREKLKSMISALTQARPLIFACMHTYGRLVPVMRTLTLGLAWSRTIRTHSFPNTRVVSTSGCTERAICLVSVRTEPREDCKAKTRLTLALVVNALLCGHAS